MCNICVKYSLKGIELYQKTLSKDHGPLKQYYPGGYCRYIPSCSEYTKISLKKYGFIKGWRRGIWRILRCNPFSQGGIDEP